MIPRYDLQADRPGLRPCPTCRRGIARNARTCPHCGRAITSWLTWAVLAGVVLVGVGRATERWWG